MPVVTQKGARYWHELKGQLLVGTLFRGHCIVHLELKGKAATFVRQHRVTSVRRDGFLGLSILCVMLVPDAAVNWRQVPKSKKKMAHARTHSLTAAEAAKKKEDGGASDRCRW